MNKAHYYEIKVTTDLNQTSSCPVLQIVPLLYQEVDQNTFCVCCLVQTGPFIKLSTCKHVELLRTVSEIECNYNDKLVCYYCHYLLKKFSLFRQQVKENLTSVHKVINIQANKRVLNLIFKPTEHVNIEHSEKNDSLQLGDPIKLEIDFEHEAFSTTEIKEEYNSASDNESDIPLCDIKIEQDEESEKQIIKHVVQKENCDKAENKKKPGEDAFSKTVLEDKLTDILVVPSDNDIEDNKCGEDDCSCLRPVDDDKYTGKVETVILTEEQMLEEREKVKKKYENFIFKCVFCFMGFNQEDSYKIHIAYRHYKSPYVCQICKVSFKKKKRLTQHRVAHYKRYECVECGAMYTSLHSTFDHYCNVHDKIDRNFKCDFYNCGFVTDNSRKLKYHKKGHRSRECEYCSKIFESGTAYKNHVSMDHNYKKNHCKECGKDYLTLSTYNEHRKRLHSKGPKAYCVECDVIFPSEYSLKKHILYNKKHNKNTKIFICDYCKKKFDRKSDLRFHISFGHLNIINNRCSICDKNFRRQKLLIRHIEFVHNKKQAPRTHICNHCGNGFTSRSILANHVRTHTGERPFKCSNCPATFAQSAARYTHNKLVHKVRGGCTKVSDT